MSEDVGLVRSYFKLGDHVILDAEDGIVAGYLCDCPPDEGVMLQVTHSMRPKKFELSAGQIADLAGRIMRTPEWKQKLILALAGRLDGLRLKGSVLRDLSADVAVEAMREDHVRRGDVTLTENEFPVLTFYAFGTYSKMRLTSDHSLMVSVSSLDEDLAAETEKFLKEQEAEKLEKDEDGSV